MTVSTEQTIDIETSGNAVALALNGHALVGVHIRGDAAADYAVDVKRRQGSWIQAVTAGYSGNADYDDVVEQPAHELRIRCTSGTAGSGDQATITLIADGG